MSKRSQEKRKVRAKEKVKMARRMRGMSPLSRLAGDGSEVECWMHYVEADDRTVNLVVFRAVRGGGWAGAFFLVEYECVGIKDAFCRFDVVPREVVEMYRENSKESGARVVKVDGERVRAIVGGAIRWGREHAFRAPAGLMKCLAVLGGTVDVANGDVAEFGTEEGGLRFVGLRRDLERLLMEESVEEFMEREDVECVFMEGGGGIDGEFGEEEEWEDEEISEEEMSEAGEEIAENLLAMNGELSKEVKEWLEAKGEKPHEQLEAVMLVRMVAAMKGLAAGKLDRTVGESMEEVLTEMGGDPLVEGLRAANGQVEAYVEATKGEFVEGRKGLEV